MSVKYQGWFDCEDVRTNRVWRFRWEYRDGGYAPHYDFYVWDDVCGHWTFVCDSFDVNEGIARVNHMDKLALSTYLVESALLIGC